jgi:hypothetical protein
LILSNNRGFIFSFCAVFNIGIYKYQDCEYERIEKDGERAVILDYIKRKWLFLLIVLIFILLNIWVWSSVLERPADDIKPSEEFVESNKISLMQ